MRSVDTQGIASGVDSDGGTVSRHIFADQDVFDRVRNLGDRPRVTMTVGTVFPNMSFHGKPAPGLKGAVESGSYSEENARIFYRRWAGYMSEED